MSTFLPGLNPYSGYTPYARPAYAPYAAYVANPYAVTPYARPTYMPAPVLTRVMYVPYPVSQVPAIAPTLVPATGPQLASAPDNLSVVTKVVNAPGLQDTLSLAVDPKKALPPVSDDDRRLLKAIHRLRDTNPNLKTILTPDNIEQLEKGFKSPESSLKLALDMTIGDSLREELHHKRWWRRKAARSALKQFETAMGLMPIPRPVKNRVKAYFDELRVEKTSSNKTLNDSLRSVVASSPERETQPIQA